LSDPGQRTNVARYFKFDVATEQCSDLIWVCTLADTGKKLLSDVRVLFSAHGLLLAKDRYGLLSTSVAFHEHGMD
jgi:hypothetical protein